MKPPSSSRREATGPTILVVPRLLQVFRSTCLRLFTSMGPPGKSTVLTLAPFHPSGRYTGFSARIAVSYSEFIVARTEEGRPMVPAAPSIMPPSLRKSLRSIISLPCYICSCMFFFFPTNPRVRAVMKAQAMAVMPKNMAPTRAA